MQALEPNSVVFQVHWEETGSEVEQAETGLVHKLDTHIAYRRFEMHMTTLVPEKDNFENNVGFPKG